MDNNEPRTRYLELSRRQLRRELDEMGYGQRARSIAGPDKASSRTTGFIMAFAAVTALLLGLSLPALIS